MNNTWLQKRQHIFIRDLTDDFISTKIEFNKILKEYKKSSTIPLKTLELWIGSEKNKGQLWHLKDLSHKLFRSNDKRNNLYEHLFDWTIASISHEAIKLKEYTFQINAYRPLLEDAVENHKHDKKLSKIINEHFELIEKANIDIKKELGNISKLFIKAVEYLNEIFILHKDNKLLVKFLLDNKEPIEDIFSRGAQKNILKKMFANGINDALLYTADTMRQNGWHKDSDKYLKKAGHKN